MTLHWKYLTTEGRIEAIKSKWHLGISGLQLSKLLGTTRNGVIGMYNRYRHLMPDHPLNRQTEGLRKASEARRQRLPKQPKAKAVKRTPAAPFVRLQQVDEDYGPGVPMGKLGAFGRECRWAVNDAPRPEDHRFCGRPSDGPWCEHHKARSTAPEIGWGFK
jgi:hypothetical protein